MNSIKSKAMSGLATVSFLLYIPVIIFLLNAGSEVDIEFDSAYLFVFFVVYIVWLLICFVFNRLVYFLKLNRYYSKKALVFYSITSVIFTIIYVFSFFDFLTNEDANINYSLFESIMFVLAPLSLNYIFAMITIYPLRKKFYSSKDINLINNKIEIDNKMSDYTLKFGHISIPLLDSFAYDEKADLPEALKNTIGVIYDQDSSQVVPLNFESVKQNPRTQRKYIKKVTNEEREALLNKQLDFFEREILNDEYYKFHKNLEDKLEFNEITKAYNAIIDNYTGDADVEYLKEHLSRLLVPMSRAMNYIRLINTSHDNLHKMLKDDFKGISIGNTGERIVDRELSRRKRDIHNYSGYNLFYEGFNTEFDNILVSTRGVFVLEVKNIGSNKNSDYLVKVEKDGRYSYYRNGKQNEITGRSPIQQNNEHRDMLISFLIDKLGKKIPVIPFVVFSNDNIDIENESQNILIRYNMVSTQHDTYPDVLTEEEVEEIIQLLNKYAGEDQTFEMFDHIGFHVDVSQQLLSKGGLPSLIFDPLYDAIDIHQFIFESTVNKLQ